MGQTHIVIDWCYCRLSFTNPRIKDGLLEEEEFPTSHSSICLFITAVPSPLFWRQELGFSGHGFLGHEEADIAIIIIIIIICSYYLLQIQKQNMGFRKGRISIINFPSSFALSILLIDNCSSIPTFLGSKNWDTFSGHGPHEP
jgi:hypothetical protein